MDEAHRGPGGPAIVTEGLVRRFGHVRAVDGLSLKVPAGVVFGFLGPNGAGKTTTIRLLLGLVEPSAGHARVLGFDPVHEGTEVRTRCGVLLEDIGLYDRLSAEDNLEFYGRIWNMPRGDRRARTRKLLTRAGLWDRRREAVQGWSRGMRQKLAVARAFLHRPQLLFLDEPTNGLDPASARELRDELRRIATVRGVTVFLTTHVLSEAQKVCDLVGILRAGKLVGMGRPQDLGVRGSTTLEDVFQGLAEDGP